MLLRTTKSVLTAILATLLLTGPTGLAVVVHATASASMTSGSFDDGSYGDNLSTSNRSSLDCSYDGLANICQVWGSGYTVAHDTVDWQSGAFDAKTELSGVIIGNVGTPYWEVGAHNFSPQGNLEINAGDDDYFADEYAAQARFIWWLNGTGVDTGDGYEITDNNKGTVGSYTWSAPVEGSSRNFSGYLWNSGSHSHTVYPGGNVNWVQSQTISLEFESICRIRLLSSDDTERTYGYVSSDQWSLYVAAWDNGGITLIDYWTIH